MVPELPEEAVIAAIKDPERLAATLSLKIKSFICTPMIGRGKFLGALTVVYTDTPPHSGEADQRLFEDLATRTAVAIENSRL